MSSSILYKHFSKMWEEKFNECYISSKSVSIKFLNRLQREFKVPEEEIEKLLYWVLDNWDALKKELNLKGSPSIVLICSPSFFPRFRDLMREGLSKDTPTYRNRIHLDGSSSEGW